MRIFNKIYSLAVFMMACTCLMSCTEGNDWNIDDAFSRLFGVDGENFTIEAEDTRATGMRQRQWKILMQKTSFCCSSPSL